MTKALPVAAEADVGAVTQRARRRLMDAGVASADLDARVLVGAVLGLDTAGLLMRSDCGVDSAAADAVEHLVSRRVANEPVSRILGHREFWSLEFTVTPATLDPRPDSETLVSACLELAQIHDWHDRKMRFADLGTGTGCLLTALLTELPEAHGLGCDRSYEALRVARDNAQANGVDGRATFLCADWLAGLDGGFDLIISNPPYICSGDLARLPPEVAQFDPQGALDGGCDGLDAYRAIAAQATAHLVQGGWLVLEVGDGQADAVLGLLAQCGFLVGGAPGAEVCDLSGTVRCVRAQLLHN